MAHDVISTCPVCSGELAVTRLRCGSCGTTLEGDFSVGRFGRLDREQLALLESFLRSRGNLREMERELGISYPTVRSRVEALVRTLGFGPRTDDDERATEPGETRESILERLARHEISAEDAAQAIRALGEDPPMTTEISSALEHRIGAQGLFAVRLRSGSVRLRAADGDTVRVTDEAGGDVESEFLVERGDGRLSIAVSKGLRIGRRQRRHGAARLAVDVPRGATVSVASASGEINADGLLGDQRYETVSGDVTLTRVAGRVAIDVVSGDVRLTASGELALRARSVSGDVEARAGRLSELSLATTSGDLSLAGALEPSDGHRIESVSGDTLVALAGGARIEVASVTGDLDVDVPHRVEGGRGRRVVTIGDGRAVLAISSMSGDVRIVAARTLPEEASPPSPPPPAEPVSGLEASGRGPSDAAIAAAYEEARLGILRSLERGEIDVTEAGRRLEALDAPDVPGASTHG